MEQHDDGKTIVIDLKKNAESTQSRDDLTLTHSSLFPVKPKKHSVFRNPTFLAGLLLLLLIVAVFVLVSSIGREETPAETTPAITVENNDPPLFPALRVNGLSEAVPVTGELHSRFVLLTEADSLKAIAVKNGNEIMYPASLTKIMTFLVAYDRLSSSLDKQLTLTEDIKKQYPEGSRVGIDKGDLLTVEQCMYAMLLESDTDAVLMLVKEVAGDENAFAALMNEKAEELGLVSTHFTNANGLHDKNHYTTPAEMTVIFAKALENELFHTIITAETYVTYLGYYKDGQYTTYRMTFANSTLVDRFKDNGISPKLANGLTVIGGKTGFTDEAKSCQAALAVDENGKEYIAILGNAPSSLKSAKDTAYFFGNYIK
ncbi:MAG: D-alanyl-D-alanine carboxypeptidase [Ruminococcaceae bacterium]|nr:D-alanyl-D-alanine carboxypeptidase [Oscillospiraceae bacterium]